MKPTTGIIVGVGSVGRRHATVMAGRYERLIVVDQDDNALEWAGKQLPNVTRRVKSIDEVATEVAAEPGAVTAVIASWGPHHFAAFMRLVELGVSRVFCEKPVAASIGQIEIMRKTCDDRGVRLTAGFHLRYRGIPEFVNEATRMHLGGGPTSFVVDGGARCIATNGSHWLDLAIAVFGSSPVAVVASLRSASVNPRSPDLLYWDGVASWEFPGGERLTINYDNASSVHERVRIYAATGVVDIDSSFRLRALARDREEVARDPRVARVGDVNVAEPLAEYATEFGEVLSVQLDELEGLRPTSYGTTAVLDSAAALVAAFEASRLGRRLDLPATADVVAGSAEWNIS